MQAQRRLELLLRPIAHSAVTNFMPLGVRDDLQMTTGSNSLPTPSTSTGARDYPESPVHGGETRPLQNRPSG